MKKECKLMELGRIMSFESEKDLISKYISDMEYFKEGEIVPFKALLANNIRDRQLDRFTKKTLKIFEKTLPSKTRLLNHDMKERTGVFYYAKVIKKSFDEVIPLFENTNFPGLESHLKEIEEKDGGLYFLESRFYLLNKTPKQQENVANTIGGVDGYMSIQSTYLKAVPVYEETKDKQRIKYFELQPMEGYPSEAIEGSSVFLGAQYTAQVTKEFIPADLKSKWVELENIKSNPERELCKKLDEFIQKGIIANVSSDVPEFMESHETWDYKFIESLPDEFFINKHYPIYEKQNLLHLANFRNLVSDIGNGIIESDKIKEQIKTISKKLGIEYSYKKKGNKMAEIILSVPSLNIAKVIDPEKSKEWQEEIDTAVNVKLAETKKAVELQNKIEKVFGKDFDVNVIENIKKDADAYRVSLVSDAVFYGKQAKAIIETDESAKKEFFEKMEIEQVKEWIANYKSMITVTPNERQVKDNLQSKNSGNLVEVDCKKSFVNGYQLTV